MYAYARLILVILLAVAGCGSGQTATTARRTAPKVPTAADLKAAMLGPGDLPAGYTHSADQSPELDPPSPTPTPCERLFDEFGNTGYPGDTSEATDTSGATDSSGAGLPRAAADLTAAYERSAVGPFLELALVTYPNDAGPRRSLAVVRDEVSKCGQFTTTDPDGSKVAVKIAAATFPRLGDDNAAFKLDATGMSGDTPIALSGFLVAVQVSGTLCTVVHFGLPNVDQAETETIAKKAVDKLTPIAK